MDIFESLREDHQKQRTLVSLLTKTHGDSNGRNELFARLKRELKNHEAAEERYFYSPLMEEDESQTQARHSVAEHHEIDELIEELEKTDCSSSGWISTARKLEEKLIHHLDEEEQQVFQLAGRTLSDSQKERLAEEYRNAMAEGLGEQIQ